MIDFDRINQAALLCLESLCCELLPGGERDGREYKVGDLGGGKGRSMSVNLRTGVWKDFAGDESGSDPISLVSAIHRTKMGEAAKWLNERLNAGGLEAKAPKAKHAPGKDDPEDWEAMDHVPAGSPQPPEEFWVGSAKRKLKPVLRWAWFHPDGRLVGYTNRMEWDGHKDVLPCCWCRHKDGRQAWRTKSFPKPRVLYRLPEIAARPNDTVLVVEGEKTADAAQQLLPQVVVTTWPGGCKALGYADWSHLKGRRVIVWPDHDLKTDPKTGELLPDDQQPGWLAGVRAVEAIREAGAESARFIPPFLGLTKDGWDLADCAEVGVTAELILAHIKATKEGNRLHVPGTEPEAASDDYDGPPQGHEEALWAEHAPQEAAPPATPPALPPPTEDSEEFPFRILGHNKGLFYYLPNSGRQIVELSPTAHSANNLLQLARLSFWEMSYPGKRGFNAVAAANDLIQRAYRVGIFDKSLKRGRGCWLDQKRIVYHVGNRLIVDAEPHDIHAFKSSFIYELAVGMEPETAPPCSSADAAKLITLCQSLAWERPLDAHLLAGWCVIAPICGALAWRPSVWVTGPSQSGKTWTCDNIVKALVGKIMLESQGGTTAAGIRAALQSDARPVYKDESEDPKVMEDILELVRCSTSDDSAPILKGSTGGGEGVAYTLRSCFCFSAIGMSASAQADTSRVTPLVLRRIKGEEGKRRFAVTQDLWRQSVGREGYAVSIRTRTLALARVIAENALRFAQAVSDHTGERRLGQQLGTMLAGAYSLSSPKVISQAEADAWIAAQDWSVFSPDDSDDDHNRALNRLMDTIIQLDAAISRPVQKMAVGEVIDAALNAPTSDTRVECCDLLIRHGIRAGTDGIAVSNTHTFLAGVYRETEWADSWRVPLSRVKGAAVPKTSVRFGKGTQPTKCVLLPLSLFQD